MFFDVSPPQGLPDADEEELDENLSLIQQRLPDPVPERLHELPGLVGVPDPHPRLEDQPGGVEVEISALWQVEEALPALGGLVQIGIEGDLGLLGPDLGDPLPQLGAPAEGGDGLSEPPVKPPGGLL